MKRLLYLLVALLFLFPLCLGVSKANVRFVINGNGVPEAHAHLPGGAHAPGGGVCAGWIGLRVEGNPFHGWPVKFHEGDWNTISTWWCDPDYFPGYTHWGIDIARRDWDESIDGAEVVSTAIVARVKRAGYSNPPRWNSGMGNFVQIEAWLPTYNNPDCSFASVVDPFAGGMVDLQEGELEQFAQEDWDAGQFEQCWYGTGWVATYMHLKDIAVEPGQLVFYGDVLGHVDNTGNSTGSHLHYQINMPGADGGRGQAVDPAPTMADTYSDALREVRKGNR